MLREDSLERKEGGTPCFLFQMFSSSCHLVSLLPKHHKLIFYGRSYKNEWQLLPTPLCPAMEKEVCSRVCIVSMLTFAFIDIQVASCWGKGLLFATWGREEEAKTVAGIMVWGGVLLCRCMGLWCSKQKVALQQSWLQKIVHGTEAVMSCPAISLLSYAAEWIFCEPSWI